MCCRFNINLSFLRRQISGIPNSQRENCLGWNVARLTETKRLLRLERSATSRIWVIWWTRIRSASNSVNTRYTAWISEKKWLTYISDCTLSPMDHIAYSDTGWRNFWRIWVALEPIMSNFAMCPSSEEQQTGTPLSCIWNKIQAILLVYTWIWNKLTISIFVCWWWHHCKLVYRDT